MTEELKPNTEAKVNEDVPDVAEALRRVLEAKGPDGSPRWTLKDFHATFPPMMLNLMTHVPFLEMRPRSRSPPPTRPTSCSSKRSRAC